MSHIVPGRCLFAIAPDLVGPVHHLGVNHIRVAEQLFHLRPRLILQMRLSDDRDDLMTLAAPCET